MPGVLSLKFVEEGAPRLVGALVDEDVGAPLVGALTDEPRRHEGRPCFAPDVGAPLVGALTHEPGGAGL